jgi:hypothetical protein
MLISSWQSKYPAVTLSNHVSSLCSIKIILFESSQVADEVIGEIHLATGHTGESGGNNMEDSPELLTTNDSVLLFQLVIFAPHLDFFQELIQLTTMTLTNHSQVCNPSPPQLSSVKLENWIVDIGSIYRPFPLNNNSNCNNNNLSITLSNYDSQIWII